MKPYVVIKVANVLVDHVIRLDRVNGRRGYDAVVWMQNQDEFDPHDLGMTQDTMFVFCETEPHAIHTMQYLSDMYPHNKYMYCAAKQIMFREPGAPIIANINEQGIMPV